MEFRFTKNGYILAEIQWYKWYPVN